VSVLLLLYRASRPNIAVLGQARADGSFQDVERNSDVAAVPGVVIVRIESGLFFANADMVRDTIRAKAADPNVNAVVLDAQTIPAIDFTAAHMLIELGRDLQRQGKRLVLARQVGQVRGHPRYGTGSERDRVLSIRASGGRRTPRREPRRRRPVKPAGRGGLRRSAHSRGPPCDVPS